MAALRTGDGRALSALLLAELDRLRRRLVFALELIRELEADRARAIEEAKADDALVGKIVALQCIRGIGDNFAAVLTREVFYRSFGNRRSSQVMSGSHPCPIRAEVWIGTEASAERAIRVRARR